MNIKFLYSFILFMLLLNINVFSQTSKEEFPKIMYVTAKDGLRVRTEPSTNSETRRTLVYGEHVQVTARQDKPVTINGITDYWYRTNADTYPSWVFGGYLSEELPKDLPVFLGSWDHAENSTLFVNYYSDHSYCSGKKETDGVSPGTWKIENTNGNIITVAVKFEWYDEDTDETEYYTVTKKITIIDKDNILEEDMRDRKIKRLKRNKTGY